MIYDINDLVPEQAFVLGFALGMIVTILILYLISRIEDRKESETEKIARYHHKEGKLTLTIKSPKRRIFLNAKVDSIKVQKEIWQTEEATVRDEEKLTKLFRTYFRTLNETAEKFE